MIAAARGPQGPRAEQNPAYRPVRHKVFWNHYYRPRSAVPGPARYSNTFAAIHYRVPTSSGRAGDLKHKEQFVMDRTNCGKDVEKYWKNNEWNFHYSPSTRIKSRIFNERPVVPKLRKVLPFSGIIEGGTECPQILSLISNL